MTQKNTNSLIKILKWEDQFEKDESISREEFYKGVKEKRKITLGQLFKICYREKYDFNIYIVLPEGAFKKLKEPAVFFPQRLRLGTGKERAISWEVDEPVLYENKTHAFEAFLKKQRVFPQGDNIYFKMPFLFFYWSHKYNLTRQKYLTRIRRFIIKQGGIEQTQGKFKSLSEEKLHRNLAIIELYKSNPQKKPIPDQMIADAWSEYINRNEKDPDEAARKYCDPRTVRRIIDRYLLNRKKKT